MCLFFFKLLKQFAVISNHRGEYRLEYCLGSFNRSALIGQNGTRSVIFEYLWGVMHAYRCRRNWVKHLFITGQLRFCCDFRQFVNSSPGGWTAVYKRMSSQDFKKTISSLCWPTIPKKKKLMQLMQMLFILSHVTCPRPAFLHRLIGVKSKSHCSTIPWSNVLADIWCEADPVVQLEEHCVHNFTIENLIRYNQCLSVESPL